MKRIRITKKLVLACKAKLIAQNKPTGCVLAAVMQVCRPQNYGPYTLSNLPSQGTAWAYGCMSGFDDVSWGKDYYASRYPKPYNNGKRFGRSLRKGWYTIND